MVQVVRNGTGSHKEEVQVPALPPISYVALFTDCFPNQNVNSTGGSDWVSLVLLEQCLALVSNLVKVLNKHL